MPKDRISRRSLLTTALGGLAALGGVYALRPQAGIPVASSAAVLQPPVIGGALAAQAPDLAASGSLNVPPLLPATMDGATKLFSLTMAPGETQLLPRITSQTAGFNGTYLGPTIRVTQGDALRMLVTNHLGEATTVHWHGMHLPAAMDGGPHQAIEDGATWRPGWTVRQQAASLWYHPHLMGATQAQVGRGLAGMLIIDDATPAQQALPHTYGVDDVPLILQDQVIGDDGRLSQGFGFRGGRGGTAVTLVNGSSSPTFQTPTSRVRLRILNASSRRFYSLGLADNSLFHQVASDGGLLPAPVTMTRLELGPAERAEIIVELVSDRPTVLQTFALADGGRGFGGGGGQVGTLLTMETIADAPEATDLPASLNTVVRMDPASANVTRDMVLARGGRGFTINGQSMASDEAMMDMGNAFQVRMGDTELWRLINNSGATHLFHVHDVEYQIVDRNGAAPPPQEMGWKDTVMVHPNETVRIIMSFRDYADSATPYMFHCHILAHEDGGMMGQFVVVSPNGGGDAPAIPDEMAM